VKITGQLNGNTGVVDFTSGPNNTCDGPSGFNQSFYNVIWNCQQTAGISLTHSFPTNVLGTFHIVCTGTPGVAQLDFSNATGATWAGNLAIHGGNFYLQRVHLLTLSH